MRSVPESIAQWEFRKKTGSGLVARVGFIGAFEEERANAIWHLVSHGIPVRIWGERWGKGWKKWSEVSQEYAPEGGIGRCLWRELYKSYLQLRH